MSNAEHLAKLRKLAAESKGNDRARLVRELRRFAAMQLTNR